MAGGRKPSSSINEEERSYALYQRQRQAGAAAFVIGVDEVGRGAVAGPLTVAAVALPLEPMILGLDDSKRLTAAKRESLAGLIKDAALAIGICHVEAVDIDQDGMAKALRFAMAEAIKACERQAAALGERQGVALTGDCAAASGGRGAAAPGGRQGDLVLIDGRPMNIHPRECCVVKGDSKIACIAAASIIAKVSRDAIMIAYDEQYPDYGFSGHKGYGTAEHVAKIQEQGLIPMHRRSFCRNFLQQS